MDILRNKLCKVCSKKANIRCGQCGKLLYCSREHQFKDWVRHKANCKSNTNNANKTKNKIIKKSLRTKSTLNDQKKEIQKKNKKIEFEQFLLKGGRRKRHCQTISVKAKSIPNFVFKETLGRYASKRIKEDYDKKINEEQNNINKVQDDGKIDFHFVQKFRDILFRREAKTNKMNTSLNDSESSSYRENYNSSYDIKNQRIKKLYDLLIEHRNFLKEKILLNSNKTYYFKPIYFMIDTYFAIEKYIINFILLIKFICTQTDPLSLIKADQALNILGKELFNANNNKDGLLVFSLDCIFKRFIDVIKSKNIYQNINSIQNISKRFLYLISSIIKLSKYLEDTKMYKESLFFYISVFEMSLKFISNSKTTEKTILTSNLKFNLGSICVKKKYLNTAIKLYKEVLDLQKSLDPFCFICGVVYYNISVIYYVMDKIKESEVYLNEGIENLNKIIDSKKSSKQNDDFRRIIRLILVFYAELNLDRQNYPKAAQCLKAVIEIMIDDNQNPKLRHKTQGNKEERQSFKFYKHMKFMLGNLVRKSIISSTLIPKIEAEISLKKKQNPMSALECLYEIQYFNDNGEKVMFDENIKSIINGLFDRITFYYNEKLKAEREKDMLYRSKKKKKTDGSKIEKKLTKKYNFYARPETLPDLDVKNILKSNNISTETNDLSNFKTRARNKTIFKKKRDNILNEADKKNKENKENENNFFKMDELKFVSKDINDKIISYLDERIVKKKKIIDNEEDVSNFKYFFLLLTTLSLRQIQILNNTQGINMSMELFKNLPILFSRQFKNSLNPSQRNMFNKLRVLSLIRCKVLKDAEKPITLDNINFSIFHANINFNDFKVKQYSHIQEIIKEATNSGFSSSKKNVMSDKKNNTYIKLHSFNSNINYYSKRISFTERKDENRHNKELFKSYIEQKIFKKKLQFDEDSNDSSEDDEEEGENIENDYVQFRYRKKYDIKKLRKILIDKINNDRNDSEEEKELYLEIINSNVFVQLLNCLELKDIIELEKNFDLIIDLLKFLENLRLRENEYESFKLEDDEKEQKNKNDENNEDNKSNSSSSFSNSLNIDIDEKKVFKNFIRRATFLIEPKFFFDINNFKFLKHSKKLKKNKNDNNNNASSCVDIKNNIRKGYMFNKNINQDNEKEIKSSKNLMKYVQEPFN